MKKETRKKFSALCKNMASQYEVDDVSKSFAATPSLEQKLTDKVTEQSSFLQQINVLGVDELKGEKILGSVTGMLGKRTNTLVTPRLTANLLNLDTKGYECVKTEYDVHLLYATLDAWAKFKDFEQRFSMYVRKAMALARIKVGWHGTSVAVTTDGNANLNGEDVNKGWVQHLREYNSGAQVFDEGATANTIRVGGDGDFANLDGLVYGVLQNVSDVHRDGGDLVAILGRDLLAYDKTQLYTAQGATPTEKERVENATVTRTYGGLPAMSVPFFPARGLFITSLDNLSLYFQNGAVRQKVNDNAERDRVDHFNTLNEAYVVEDLEKAATIEAGNVALWNGTAFV